MSDAPRTDTPDLRAALVACLTDFDREPSEAFVTQWLPRLSATPAPERAVTLKEATALLAVSALLALCAVVGAVWMMQRIVEAVS